MQLSTILYDISLQAYRLAIGIASSRNVKAKQWIDGRKDIFKKIAKAAKPGEKRIWVHASSLGEFEQGRPLIEKIKQEKPDIKIVLTFFSPSGYEIRKNYPQADYIFYLPLDTKNNAERFVSFVQPSVAIFIKYDFWYHYFNELNKRSIPIILISAVFREDQIYFNPLGVLHRKMLGMLKHIFVQDEISQQLLKGLRLEKNVSIAPDTRIDRVADIAEKVQPIPIVEKFLAGTKALIGGSLYDIENKYLRQAYDKGLVKSKIIIAPHKVDEESVKQIQRTWGNKAVLYTDLQENLLNPINQGSEILIINTIGLLSSLYQYGNIAIIGGGFGKGIHNTLEPATFGLPVLFGPKYQKFNEAVALIASGGAFCFINEIELVSILNKLNNGTAMAKAGKAASGFIKENTGGTEMIFNWLKTEHLL